MSRIPPTQIQSQTSSTNIPWELITILAIAVGLLSWVNARAAKIEIQKELLSYKEQATACQTRVDVMERTLLLSK